MTYALAWPLQQAVFHMLCEDAVCANYFSHRIYDAAPPFTGEPVPEGIYLLFGDEEAVDWSTSTDSGAVHTLRLTINAPRQGYSEAKQAASAVCDAILSGDPAMSRGRIVNIRFVDAKTKRAEKDGLRQIELRFRVVTEDTQ